MPCVVELFINFLSLFDEFNFRIIYQCTDGYCVIGLKINMQETNYKTEICSVLYSTIINCRISGNYHEWKNWISRGYARDLKKKWRMTCFSRAVPSQKRSQDLKRGSKLQLFCLRLCKGARRCSIEEFSKACFADNICPDTLEDLFDPE